MTEAKEQSTILVVDDNLQNLQVLIEHLKEAGYHPLLARSGKSALQQADFANPDLILLDVIMPGMDGFETCRRLKQQEKTREIPVIFLTALSEDVDKAKGIEAGGADYVNKPFSGLELLARIRTHLQLYRYRKELVQSQHDLCQANEALVASRKKLELAAKTDPLTQLPNRREMLDKLEQELIRFERSQRPFVLALCDIDNFRVLNDRYGHECGDAVLVLASKFMRGIIRKQDLLSRWGGEEFLFAFLETDVGGGQVICEKIRHSITEQPFEYQGHQFRLSVTIGFLEFNATIPSLEAALKQVEYALDMGKRQGKNCTRAAETGR